MKPVPYVFFNGTCAAALEYYKDAIGAEVEMIMSAADMPPEFPVPEEKKDWIMHATMRVGESAIMASDSIMDTAEAMAGCSIMLSYSDVAEAKAVFDKLSDGGEITMPWEPTFWSTGFGTTTDRFGIRWMVGCDQAPGG